MKFQTHASSLDAKVKATNSDHSFESAWRLFHESFADNHELVLGALHQAALGNLRYMAASNLSGTVWLFKELGRPDLAADLINRYIAVREDDRRFFDLDNQPFRERIDDPDVIKAFKDKYDSLKDDRDPAITLLSIANKHGWSEEEIDALRAVTVDEYYRIFKMYEGQDLRKMVETCLSFRNSESMAEIAKRAVEALGRIGRESPINALRVRKYGIEPNKADA